MKKSYDIRAENVQIGQHIIGAGLKWYTVERVRLGGSKVHLVGVNCFGEEVQQNLPFAYLVTVVKD